MRGDRFLTTQAREVVPQLPRGVGIVPSRTPLATVTALGEQG